MTDFAPGTPSWVELSSPDVDASAEFYGELMGWAATEPGAVEETGGYRMFEQGGAAVAGFFPPEVPPHWGVCFAIADCDATTSKARELGATITTESMDMPIGRFSNIIDPQGAPFAVMQLPEGD